eukprot:364299-Chlamydomonas_euryale.AAC.11
MASSMPLALIDWSVARAALPAPDSQRTSQTEIGGLSCSHVRDARRRGARAARHSCPATGNQRGSGKALLHGMCQPQASMCACGGVAAQHHRHGVGCAGEAYNSLCKLQSRQHVGAAGTPC